MHELDKTINLTYNSIGVDLNLSWNQQSGPGLRPMKLILPKIPGKAPQLGLYFYRLNSQGTWEHASQIFEISPEEAKIIQNKTNNYSKVESTIWPYLIQVHQGQVPSCPFPSI